MIISFDNKIGLFELQQYIKFIPSDHLYKYFSKDPKKYIIANISDDNIHKITVLTKLASKLLGQTYIDLLMPIQKINITILDDDCMFNLPFTLGNTIFLPNKYLQRSNIKNLKTIIHELIHINQRNNLQKWINWIHNNSQWKLQNFTVCDSILNKNFVINPDTFYCQTWLFQNKFYSHNILSNQQILNKCYSFSNNIFISNNTPNNPCEYDHPFEEFAYKIADDVINKLISNQKN